MCKFCPPELDQKLVLFETRYCRLLANYFPMGKIALLIAPKSHVCCLNELYISEQTDMISLISLTIKQLKYSNGETDFNGFFNEGSLAGQTIEHFHFHLVVRAEGDGVENFKRLKKKVAITATELRKIKKML